MNKIILIGIPGAGKSTLGRRLADELNLPFFDTDELVVLKGKLKTYADFIRMALNGQFIAIQKEIIAELSRSKGKAVISTGAEVALIPKCASLMKKMGKIIHLKRDPEIILVKGAVRQSEGIRLYMQDYHQYEALADLILDNNGSEDEGLKKLLGVLDECRSW